MKVIDAFSFNDELQMLNFRLHELNDVVDFFIIVEANKTFSNNPKPYFFEENKEKYNKFLHKIIHIKVDDMPTGEGSYIRDNFQKNCAMKGINKLKLDDEDVIIFGDLDEIPRTSIISDIKKNKIIVNDVFKMEMEFYYYNFQNKHQTIWPSARILNFKKLKDLKDIINVRKISWENSIFNKNNIIKNAGWHLSYFGNIDWIINKINSIEEAFIKNNRSLYLNKEKIQKAIENNKDLFYRQGIKINKTEFYLPWNETTQTQLPKYYSMVMFPELNYLTHLGIKYNTDKSWGHLFTEIYAPHFEKFKNKKINILEIGIYLGSSLKMLEEYFPNASIHSIDIRDELINKNFGDRIKTYKCSQIDLHKFDSIFKDIKFDIIIDDGSHQTLHQLISLGHMFKYLNKNGIYVCEDLHTSLIGGHYCNTRTSTLNVLSNFVQTKKIVSEVIPPENIEYLNNNIEKMEILSRQTNSIKCARCGKINFSNLKICQCGEILSPDKHSITSVMYHV
jgi:beta-1,4-mannosyl-glycoprotein beta-1,4-N-acetylglucosaminyltransferase